MYPNIDAEQARLRLSNAKVADILKMHPYTYGQKKLHGGFSVEDAQIMCDLFQVPFDYLFETEADAKKEDG